MRRSLVCGTMLLCAASTLQAQTQRNWIRQWNHTYNIGNDPNDPDPNYLEIFQPLRTIVIYAAEPNEPFEFEARTQQWDPNSEQWFDIGEGNIDFIGDPNSGPPIAFTISVDGQGAHTYGAEHVKEISFGSYQNLTIGRVEISGNLGDPNDPNAVIHADNISGPLLITGQILDDIEIDGLYGDIECTNMQNFTLQSVPHDPNNPAPGITIAETYDHRIWWNGEKDDAWKIGTIDLGALGPNGEVDVVQLQNLYVNGPCEGDIIVRQNLLVAWLLGDVDGTVDVYGDVSGGIILGQLSPPIPADLTGTVRVRGELTGSVYIHDGALAGTGLIDIWGDQFGLMAIVGASSGNVAIAGDSIGALFFLSSMSGDVTIGGDLTQAAYVGISGGGDLTGSIEIGGDLTGKIEVWGDLEDPNADLAGGHVIVNGALNSGSERAVLITGELLGDTTFICVDYDGWDPNDAWENGDIRVDGVTYTENTPSMHIWEITGCRGDLTNDGKVDADDPNALDLVLSDPNDYALAFPGLFGSMGWHADMNEDDVIDAVDADWLDHFATPNGDCCFTGVEDYGVCLMDTDESGAVDLSDLAQVLGHYNTTSGALLEEGDFDADGDVDVSDLAAMLGAYGGTCACFPGTGLDSEGGGGGNQLDAAMVTISVVPYDTHGYTGGGFHGEVDHFVFDLKIEVNYPGSDDWLVNGAALNEHNDATFRLSSSPTTPDRYATFVAAPWQRLPGSATASVAGAYDPPDPNEVFTIRALNLGWYDTDTDSDDGPAVVMRLVIDVSEVDGADVSGGFGSVYFSTTGPAQVGDILVADLESGTGTLLTLPLLKTYSGNFYVKGQ